MRRRRRVLLPRGGHCKRRTARQIAAAAAGFDYPVTQIGVVGNVTVYCDPELGSQGADLAQQMLGTVDAPYQDMQTWFGTTGDAASVVIAPLSGNNNGSGGAYHYGCDFTLGGVLYLDATFDNTSADPLDPEVGQYVAELSEAFTGTQGGGWICGYSNGEGLPRFAAEQETPAGTLDAFATGPTWAQVGFPDRVSTTETPARTPFPPVARSSTSTGFAGLRDPADRAGRRHDAGGQLPRHSPARPRHTKTCWQPCKTWR